MGAAGGGKAEEGGGPGLGFELGAVLTEHPDNARAKHTWYTLLLCNNSIGYLYGFGAFDSSQGITSDAPDQPWVGGGKTESEVNDDDPLIRKGSSFILGYVADNFGGAEHLKASLAELLETDEFDLAGRDLFVCPDACTEMLLGNVRRDINR